jgi:hypothetical protein
MSKDDPSKAEVTPKYQQVVVPDHPLKPNTSGTSFLRTGTFPSLTDTTKQPPGFRESLALARQAGDNHLKTGGSWHHVDGNRIETTTGRKVEIIKGAYVAHRGPGNSPGPNFSSTWATNSYTQVGSKDVPIGWDPNSFPAPATAPTAPTVDPPANFVETLSFAYDGTTMGTDTQSHIDVNPATPTNSNGALQLGDVAGVTWAQRILTYVGSVNRPVPLVYAETWGESMHSYSYYSVESKTYVGSDAHPVPLVYAQTWAATMQTLVGDDGNPVPTVIARTDAGSVDTRIFAHSGDIVSWNHVLDAGKFWQDAYATTILTTSEANADITVTNTAPLITTVNTGAAVNTLTAGVEIGVFNAAVELLTLNLGNQTTLSFPVDTTIHDITTRINFLHSELASTVSDVIGVCDNISGASTSLSGVRNHLDGTFTVLNALTVLGP